MWKSVRFWGTIFFVCFILLGGLLIEHDQRKWIFIGALLGAVVTFCGVMCTLLHDDSGDVRG